MLSNKTPIYGKWFLPPQTFSEVNVGSLVSFESWTATDTMDWMHGLGLYQYFMLLMSIILLLYLFIFQFSMLTAEVVYQHNDKPFILMIPTPLALWSVAEENQRSSHENKMKILTSLHGIQWLNLGLKSEGTVLWYVQILTLLLKRMFNEAWWYIYNRWQSNVYTCQVQSTFYRYFIVLTSYMFSGLFQVQWWWFWPEEVGQWCIKVRTKSQHPCHEAPAPNAGKLLSYSVVRHNT